MSLAPLPNNSATYKHVLGADSLSAALRALPLDMQARTLASAVKEVCIPIEIAAKRFAKRSKRTGALSNSITHKIVVYPKTGKAVGLVGPDRNYYIQGRRLSAKGGKLGALYGADRPANYAHLVEYGHRIAKGGALTRLDGKGKKGKGTVGGFVPAKPFIRPAVITTHSQQAAGFYRGIERGFNAALQKYRRSG